MANTEARRSGESPESTSRDVGGAVHFAAWGFVFLILRIFAVSDYRWETAFAVSTTLSLDDGLALLFGSLMAGQVLTAILLIAVLPLLVAAQLWGPRRHRAVLMLLTTVGLVTMLALTVSFGHWWLPLASASLFAVILLLRRLPDRSPVSRASIHAMAKVGWVTGVAVLVVAAFVSTPWVPREEIETSDGLVTGYVLSVDSGYLNVLTDDHQFVILLTADVEARR